ncbi:hypothetical protein APY04_1664 [Hyphomicrobium sulfonivorans]|uniref:Secretin/TonB short N-terminal domain-containing protein n=1 Tax=Hyphomicrobium sulfonivorans TaxID=121290 RepID=A0A120CWA3_HYPSL|nr:TonB-dependent receptor [Hyphomicrobium sulfonivorans]KWT69058.1 hypothetical protein APY04_1664 [Hyphomicrobium sulfonivorans]
MAWGKFTRGSARAQRFGAALVGTTALVGGIGISAEVAAQQTQASSQAAQNTIKFAIPAQPLANAIVAFSAASGVNIVSGGVIASGIQSSAVSGKLTARQALDKLLAGTGYSYRFTGATSVTLVDPNSAADAGATVDGAIALATIDVTGGAGSSWAAAEEAPYTSAGSTAFISQEQINRVPPTSTGDMFKNTTGVLARGNRNGSKIDVNIRGMQGQGRVATMVDGAVQQSSIATGYAGYDSRTFVDPEMIGGVDIEKGPGGTPGAMGGSVNMRTMNAGDIVRDGNTVGLRLRGGMGSNTVVPTLYSMVPGMDSPDRPSLDNSFGSIAAGIVTDKVEIVAALSRREQGNYFAGKNDKNNSVRFVPNPWALTYFPGEEVFNTSQSSESSLVKGKLNLTESASVELSYMNYNSRYGEESADMLTAFGWLKMEYGPNEVNVDTYTSKFTYNPSDSKLINFVARAWASDQDDDFKGVQGDGAVFTHGYSVSNTSELDVPVGEVSLKYGWDYFNEDASLQLRPTGTSTKVVGERSMHSGFLNAMWLPLEWLKLQGGGRYDTFAMESKGPNPILSPKTGERLNPNAAITIAPFDGVQLFGKYAEGWRPPSLRETMYRESVFPNPNLRPETAKTYELGVNYVREKLLTENDRVRLKALYFNNTYDDYILRMQRLAGGLWFANAKTAEFDGFEVSGSYDAGIVFADVALTRYTKIAYCISDAKCDGREPDSDYGSPYVPPKHTGTITLGTRALDQKLTLGGRIFFAGERYLESTSNRFKQIWDPFVVYDVFGSYEVNEHFRIDGSIENITDLYYFDPLTTASVPSPGRTARVSATARF